MLHMLTRIESHYKIKLILMMMCFAIFLQCSKEQEKSQQRSQQQIANQITAKERHIANLDREAALPTPIPTDEPEDADIEPNQDQT